MAQISNNNDTLSYTASAVDDNASIDTDLNIDSVINKFGDTFFQISIPEENWNQLQPYKLQIIDANTNQEFVSTDHKSYSYTLPISPEELTIQFPFAINLQPTMKGISEDHSGIPFRIINISASTGAAPRRPSQFGPQSKSTVAAIFAGTINQASQVKKNVATLLGNAKPPNNLMDTIGDESGNLEPKSTGFYHHRLLQKFLEFYAFLKKQQKYSNLRLAFAQYKTNELYFVTPLLFTSKQSATSPMEYKWTLQLKAWKRIHVTDTSLIIPLSSDTNRKQNNLAKVLGKIQSARNTIQSVSGVIEGINSDFQHSILGPLREAALAISDAIGVAISLLELPINIVKETKQAVVSSWDQIQGQIKLLGADANELKQTFTNAATISGSLGNQVTQDNDSSDPLNAVFSNPNKYYELFQQLAPTSLNLSPFLINQIENEKDRVRSLTRTDFQNKRDVILNIVNNYANSLGMGNSTYNSIYGISTPAVTKEPTTDDYNLLFTLNEVLTSIDQLIINFDSADNGGIPSALEYAAGLASKSGIAFTIPTAKIPVPFPYGATLEILAQQYLGDSTRWLEIAVLNGLQEPYVDEVGFTVPLLFNGINNQVTVADSTNFYIGQIVYISSNTISSIKCQILNIQQVNNNYIITLNNNDLNIFKISDSAQLHAYLPNTVNSQMMIFVPSQDQVEQPIEFKKIPTTNDIDGFLNIGGVDLLLTQDGDLIIGPEGASKLAFGLNNIVQSIRLVLTTTKGSLLDHQTYGIGVPVGTASSDIDIQSLLKSTLNLFSNDKRFSKVLSSSIVKNGNALTIKISVQLAHINHVLSISVQL